ncbi:MAG TPA: polysaccharide biosynthesis protein [Bacillales bacterium]
MNQGLLKGTLYVTVAALISKSLGSLFRIPMQNIAGDEVLGIFMLVHPLYMVVLTLSVAGIPLAISKLISQARARGSYSEINGVYITASILALSFGAFGFIVLAGFSGPISTAIGGPSTQPAILVVSLSLLVAPYTAVYRGFFQGFGEMRPTAFSQVTDQSVRVGLILVVAFVLIQQGVAKPWVAAGIMAGSSLGALASLFYLRLTFVRSSLRPVSEERYQFSTFLRLARRILKLSFPIAVGSLAVMLMNLADSFTIPASLKAFGQHEIYDLYGVYGRGLSLVQIATVFSASLVLPMIPRFTETDSARTIHIMNRAQRLNHLVSWPAAIGAMALALPLNLALFGNLQGTLVFSILGFSSLFNAFAVLGTGILTGINLQRKAAYIVLVAAAVKVPLNILLVSNIGLVGAAISSVLVYGLLLSANMVLIKKHSPVFTIFPTGSGTYIFASCLMGAVLGIPTLFAGIVSWTRIEAFLYVAAALVAGIAIYSGIIWRFNGAEEFSGLPGFNKIFSKS